MAALSRAFRVPAGREWLSVSLLKAELAVSCKTRRRFCLCASPQLPLRLDGATYTLQMFPVRQAGKEEQGYVLWEQVYGFSFANARTEGTNE